MTPAGRRWACPTPPEHTAALRRLRPGVLWMGYPWRLGNTSGDAVALSGSSRERQRTCSDLLAGYTAGGRNAHPRRDGLLSAILCPGYGGETADFLRP